MDCNCKCYFTILLVLLVLSIFILLSLLFLLTTEQIVTCKDTQNNTQHFHKCIRQDQRQNHSNRHPEKRKSNDPLHTLTSACIFYQSMHRCRYLFFNRKRLKLIAFISLLHPGYPSHPLLSLFPLFSPENDP